jgi:outer membrane protein assembly factor BamD (BamD/ComL family)
LAQTDTSDIGQEQTGQSQDEESIFGYSNEEEPPDDDPFEEGPQQTLLEENQGETQREETGNKPKIVEVERRKLPEIENDLMHHSFQIAEYYLLKVEDYDSAKVYFNRFVETYNDTLLTPKALYSLRLIYLQKGHQDSQAVQDMEDDILSNYPESVFAQQLLKEKGLYSEEKTMDKSDEISHQLFLEAEALYANRRFNEALDSYQRIADSDTVSQWGVKALYAKAWIYEHDLEEKDSALATYEEIIRRYPNASSYIAVAKNKTTPLATGTPGQSTGLDSLETLASGDTTKDASLAVGAIVGSGQDSKHLSDQLIDPDKIQWRMNRYKATKQNFLER